MRKYLKKQYAVILCGLMMGATFFQNCGSFKPASGTIGLDSAGGMLYEHANAQPIVFHEKPSGSTRLTTAKIVATILDSVDISNTDLVKCETNDVNQGSCDPFIKAVTQLKGYKQVVFEIKDLTEGEQGFWIYYQNFNDEIQSAEWSVDLSPPNISITNKSDLAKSNDADFAVVVTDSSLISMQKCGLEGQQLKDCQSFATFPNLAAGSYQFVVQAKDELGNESSKKLSFAIAAANSNFFDFLSKPDLVTLSTIANFTFERGANVAKITCSLDGAGASDCTSGLSLTNLSINTHALKITAYNASNVAIGTNIYTWKLLSLPIFNEHSSVIVAPYAIAQPYPFTLSVQHADYFEWEFSKSINSSSTEKTNIPVLPLYLQSYDHDRFVKYCVTAVNAVGRVKKCGNAYFSLFSIGTTPTFAGTALPFNDIDVAKFRPIGIYFATDDKYIYFSNSRYLINGSAVVRGFKFVQNGTKILAPPNSNASLLVELPNVVASDWRPIILDGADPLATGSPLSATSTAAYFYGQALPNSDGATIKLVNDQYSYDKARIHFHHLTGTGTSLSNGTKPTIPSYRHINSSGQVNTIAAWEYAHDGQKVFHRGITVEGIQPPVTFEDYHGSSSPDFLLGSNAVAFRGQVVSGLSPVGFKIISGPSPYVLISNSKAYVLNVNSRVLTAFPGSADAGTFRRISNFYYQDANHVWYVSANGAISDLLINPASENPTAIDQNGYVLKLNSSVYVAGTKSTSVIDPSTFVLASPSTLWFKDSQAVYFIDSIAAGLTKVDMPPTGLEVLFYHGYARNCSVGKVYFKTAQIVAADCGTFRTKWPITGAYAKDATNCYFGANIIDPTFAGCAQVP